jgi:hypothetical protein
MGSEASKGYLGRQGPTAGMGFEAGRRGVWNLEGHHPQGRTTCAFTGLQWSGYGCNGSWRKEGCYEAGNLRTTTSIPNVTHLQPDGHVQKFLATGMPSTDVGFCAGGLLLVLLAVTLPLVSVQFLGPSLTFMMVSPQTWVPSRLPCDSH